jgi:hypothetical protein
VPPARAAPLSTGSAIVAAKILLKTQLFIFAPLFIRIRPGVANRDRTPLNEKRAMRRL